MRILKMYPTSINGQYIDILVDAMRNGSLIAYPTDTMYAIGCDALNNKAIENICKIKGIDPRKQHLSITCAGLSQASEYAKIDNRAFAILKQYIPGPFTFILPTSTTLPKVFKGRRQVGIRIPDNPIARHLAEALGNPLLTTTAQWSDDNENITIPEAIADHYEPLGIEFVIDAGEGTTDLSTIVDLTDSDNPEIIRQGKGVL